MGGSVGVVCYGSKGGGIFVCLAFILRIESFIREARVGSVLNVLKLEKASGTSGVYRLTLL